MRSYRKLSRYPQDEKIKHFAKYVEFLKFAHYFSCFSECILYAYIRYTSTTNRSLFSIWFPTKFGALPILQECPCGVGIEPERKMGMVIRKLAKMVDKLTTPWAVGSDEEI